MVITQVQPHSIMAIMQVQQACIILHVIASPLLHMTRMPSLVISHLHMPIIMLVDRHRAVQNIQPAMNRKK